MTVSNEFHGYTVIKVQLREGSDSVHCVYLKEHRVRERTAEKPPDRTLFALGIPPYANEECLTRAFSTFGNVEAVYLHAFPSTGIPPKEISKIFKDHPPIKGFKVAYIVFENSMGLSNALTMDPTSPLILSTDESPILLGINKMCKDYNERLVDVGEVSKEVDEYMQDFDSKMEVEEKELKALTQEPDDDGWVTVTKKSRKPGFSRKESVTKNILKKEQNKRSKKELLNFYRFQVRESKMNHLVKLREKFAEDKKKVALMKQSRKFRPFC